MTNEVRTVSETGGAKGVKDEKYDLLPWSSLAKVARLYAAGAEKYDSHNWRRGYEWSKSFAAMMRHATQFWEGEDTDAETGAPHMASVVFHALALLEFMDRFPQFDDRYQPAPVEPAPDLTGEAVRLTKTGYGVVNAHRTSDGRLYDANSGLLYTVEEWAEFGWAVA